MNFINNKLFIMLIIFVIFYVISLVLYKKSKNSPVKRENIELNRLKDIIDLKLKIMMNLFLLFIIFILMLMLF